MDISSIKTLQALVNRIIPSDDYPSGWDAGVGTFIAAILAADLKSSAPLVEAGLALLSLESQTRYGVAGFGDLGSAAQDEIFSDALARRTQADWGMVAPDEFARLMIRLSMQGFYGDPGNGGNRGAVSWDMIRYHPLPAGAAWSDLPGAPLLTAAWDSIRDGYDAIVVGAGAGGGIAACVLAEAGLHVLLVERGAWLPPPNLRPDHLRNQRSNFGYDTPAGPPAAGNPRVLVTHAGAVVVTPTDPRWSNNAMTLGGGTRVFGAQAWRFCPEDFRMATTYGVPENSSLADWPLTYAELETDYDRAEWEIGVSGDPTGNPYAGPRLRGYPMPPLPMNQGALTLQRGAHALGLNTSPVPLLINSVPYNGRGACIHCGVCVGFGCQGDYKNGTHNTVIPRAIATGRGDVLVNTQAERILTNADGIVMGVALITDDGGTVRRREVRVDQVLLGAGAIETARLLLNSPSRQEPKGLGNNYDQVGRNLQGHVYSGALGLFDETVQDCIGPGPRISVNNYRHHNEGLVGGAMLANDFVPTPLNAQEMLTAHGAIPLWGAASKSGMRELYSRLVLAVGPTQETPNPESRVTVDPQVRDRFGIPVARLSGSLHAEDFRTAKFISDRAVEWLQASGAQQVYSVYRSDRNRGPSGGQHQAGTCRMGVDPNASVTDKWGKVWGHDNLHVVDASLHVTNGGVNPVLTIMALAFRVSRHLVLLNV